MSVAEDIAVDLSRKADRIERVKDGRALTEDEARILKARAFLRTIAPYLFPASAPEGKQP